MRRNSRTKKARQRKRIRGRRWVSMALLIVMASSIFIQSFASGNSVPKEEVVYVNLHLDGSVDAIYVVNSFELNEDGMIVDHGDYTALRELTSLGSMQMENEIIKIDAKAGNLYYEGKLKDNSIPWTFDIRYFMNGKEYKGEEIAGKSGELRICASIDKNIDEEDVFFKNFTLQTAIVLDSSRCKSIYAEGATIVNAGKNKQVLFTILPGKKTDIEIRADVKEFEMEGISINAIPMNMDFSLEDDPEFSDQLKEMQNGIKKLSDGAASFRDGTEDLKSGTLEFKDGIIELKDGVDKLSDGTEELSTGSIEIADGMMELKDGINDLQKGTKELSSGARKLDKGAKELLDGSKNLHKGARSLSNGLERLSSQNNDLMYGAGQIFDSVLSAANQQLELVNPLAPKLKRNNFKAVLDTMIEEVGGIALQTAIKQAEDEIRKAVTEGVRSEIESQYGGAGNEIIDAMMASEEIQNKIEHLVGLSLEEQMDDIVGAAEGGLASDSGYISLLGLRSQLAAFEIFYNGLDGYTKGVKEISEGADGLLVGMAEWRSGMAELRGGTDELKEGAVEINDGVIELKDGVAKLYDGSTELKDGIIELHDGTIELKDGVIKLLDGAVELHDGAIELYDGAVTMAEGTLEFKDKTADIERDFKDKIKEKIEEMLGQNFVPKSFVSDQNTNVLSVQFAMKTGDILIEKENSIAIETEAKLSFFDRLKGLIGL